MPSHDIIRIDTQRTQFLRQSLRPPGLFLGALLSFLSALLGLLSAASFLLSAASFLLSAFPRLFLRLSGSLRLASFRCGSQSLCLSFSQAESALAIIDAQIGSIRDKPAPQLFAPHPPHCIGLYLDHLSASGIESIA